MTQRFGRLCSVGFVLTFSVGGLIALGCVGGFTGTSAFLGLPFPNVVGSDPNTGGGGGAGGGGGFFGGGSQGAVAPCEEALKRKFVTLTLRNQSRDDYIHYFMLLIAFVDTDTQSGAVCPDDIPIYTNFGYTQVPEGGFVEFGNFCVVGPALVYFHQAGRFREVGGELGSAIGPAQGTSGTFDGRFGSNGLQVPVPNLIAFHNPGTTQESANLRVSRPLPDPCFAVDIGGGVDPACAQDGFYYVDENDNFIGSSQLGTGSGRRVPSEFQGTGCQCLGFSQGYWTLAPSGTTAANAQCNQFLRGGRIEFVFNRDDRDPPIPQLVWRVTDDSGSLVHDFDARTGVR